MNPACGVTPVECWSCITSTCTPAYKNGTVVNALYLVTHATVGAFGALFSYQYPRITGFLYFVLSVTHLFVPVFITTVDKQWLAIVYATSVGLGITIGFCLLWLSLKCCSKKTSVCSGVVPHAFAGFLSFAAVIMAIVNSVISISLWIQLVVLASSGVFGVILLSLFRCSTALHTKIDIAALLVLSSFSGIYFLYLVYDVAYINATMIFFIGQTLQSAIALYVWVVLVFIFSLLVAVYQYRSDPPVIVEGVKYDANGDKYYLL